MEVTIAMGHFCDTHGPCIILSTSAFDKIPENQPFPNIPVCSACESIEFETVYSCEDEKKHYLTSRIPLDSSTAPLLKDAILRSLSIEVVIQDGKNAGTVYFGDNSRGHIIAHVFNVRDSFARGFRRRYCIIVLGKHQISLLSHYEFLENNLSEISTDLQQKAEKHSTTITPNSNMNKDLRSLPGLTGERNVFAHLHMWFVFLLRAKIFHIIPHNIPTCPVDCPRIEKLRILKLEMPNVVFDTVLYCTLTGILIEEKNVEILNCFQELLPKGFRLPNSGKFCSVIKTEDMWSTEFHGTLPQVFPSLHISIKAALENENMTNSALYYHTKSLIMHWFNIACVLSWAQSPCEKLIQTLGVCKYDMVLLSYWITQSGSCVEMCKTDYFSL